MTKENTHAQCVELVTVAEVSTVFIGIETFAGNIISGRLKSGDVLVTRQNAEEVIAAKDARIKELEKLCNDTEAQLLSYADDKAVLEADNASLIHDLNRIKEHEVELSNDNMVKDAWIKDLEADNKRLREALNYYASVSPISYDMGHTARAALSGKERQEIENE